MPPNPERRRFFSGGGTDRRGFPACEHPQLGVERPELVGAPYRFLVLTGFPYIVVYNADRRQPLIVRLLHDARDVSDALRLER